MLVKKQDVLVPHDMDESLLEFILEDEGKSRFIIGMHIPEASCDNFVFDTAYIENYNGELRVHAQGNSPYYQLYMYAWEHVYCLMPSAKHRRKLGTGWVSPTALDTVEDPMFGKAWHSRDFLKFVRAATDANS